MLLTRSRALLGAKIALTTTATTDTEELAIVELTHALEGFNRGTVGTVVSARPSTISTRSKSSMQRAEPWA